MTEPAQAIKLAAGSVSDSWKPYPAYNDSGIPWLGQVPTHWGFRRLRNVADLRVGNTANMPFMQATATPEEIEAFCLCVGDAIVTKDSEEWRTSVFRLSLRRPPMI